MYRGFQGGLHCSPMQERSSRLCLGGQLPPNPLLNNIQSMFRPPLHPPHPRYDPIRVILTRTKSMFWWHHLVVDVLNVVKIKKLIPKM